MNEESIAKMKNSYDEQKLRDEVIYLHYLWQQGPPPPPHHHHHSQSNPILPHWRLHHDPFPPSHTRSLPPITSTSFKKKKVTKPRPIFSENRRVNVENNKVTKPDSPGWPVPVPVSQNSPQTGWPTPNPKSDPLPPPPQPQDIERLSALHLQNKACKAFRDSLLIGSDNDDDDDDEDEDEDEDDNEDSDGSRFKQFENFFIEVFMEDNELRGYYQRCFEDGEFLCLVCAAEKKNNKKKKYKDCIGLVQHSKLILRTANKVAHRAFGEVVCKVLGWDVNRFPTIVINGEPLGPVQSLGEPKESVAAAADDDGKDGPCETEVIAVSLEHAKDPVEEHAKGVDQSIAECSCKEGDIVENGGEEARYEMKGETKEKVVFGA